MCVCVCVCVCGGGGGGGGGGGVGHVPVSIQTIFMSAVTISSSFCHSFEAMFLARILPQQGLSKWLTFSPKFTSFKTFNFFVKS